MDTSNYLKPRDYEMMAVLVPDQGDEETQAAIEKMLGYITDENGTVDSVSADSPWGRRRLAYTIRHEGVDYRDGHYVLVYFTAMPSAISEIERELKLDVNVIRYLLLINDPEMGEKIDPNAVVEDEEAEGEEATEEVATEEAAPSEEAPAEEAAGEEPAAEEVSAEEAPAEEADAEEEAPAEEEAAEEAEESDKE